MSINRLEYTYTDLTESLLNNLVVKFFNQEFVTDIYYTENTRNIQSNFNSEQYYAYYFPMFYLKINIMRNKCYQNIDDRIRYMIDNRSDKIDDIFLSIKLDEENLTIKEAYNEYFSNVGLIGGFKIVEDTEKQNGYESLFSSDYTKELRKFTNGHPRVFDDECIILNKTDYKRFLNAIKNRLNEKGDI